MSLRTLENTPDLSERCYEALLEAICSGEMTPDHKYTQEALAARLGVSRQPVLQALQLLRRQGLIRDEDNRRGVRVTPLNATFIQNLYQVRGVLDALAARAAAALPRPELKEPGAQLIRAGRAAAARRDLTALVRADLDFHAFVYRASHNPLLEQTVAVHWHQTRRLMAVYLRRTMSFRAVWAEHQAMLQAIVRGDARAAEKLSREHAENACQTMLRLLFRQDEHLGERSDAAAAGPAAAAG
ncbi:MAG: GntR family transcriptional regulator [Lautropia sp.]